MQVYKHLDTCTHKTRMHLWWYFWGEKNFSEKPLDRQRSLLLDILFFPPEDRLLSQPCFFSEEIASSCFCSSLRRKGNESSHFTGDQTRLPSHSHSLRVPRVETRDRPIWCMSFPNYFGETSPDTSLSASFLFWGVRHHLCWPASCHSLNPCVLSWTFVWGSASHPELHPCASVKCSTSPELSKQMLLKDFT